MAEVSARARGRRGSQTALRHGIEAQPLSSVEWLDRSELRANDYNPNHVAPHELELLKVSILEDGWTQPIVVRDGGEIVDGFHRWLVSADANISAMTGGLVPVVKLPADLEPAQQRMATIRHNRARGQHAIVKMADIVADMVERLGVPEEEVERRLGMEHEEVRRLVDHGDMLRRHGNGAFSSGWTIADGFGDEEGS